MEVSYETHFKSNRPDGRSYQTMAAFTEQLRQTEPELAMPENLDKEGFLAWQKKVKEKARELLCMPEFTEQPRPVLLNTVQREKYRVERWEFYPDDFTAVPVLMLIPNEASAENPVPGVFCCPGSVASKEFIADEPLLPPPHCQFSKHPDRARMAKYYAENGMVAVAFDNPATAECDIEGVPRVQLCHGLLQNGLNYTGISVFQKLCFLQFFKTLPYVDTDRLAVSGHSLGSQPEMFLALLCDDFKLIIHNECASMHRDRYRSLTESIDGRIVHDIGIWHIIPGRHKYFQNPDLLAALAPKCLALNEGGPDIALEKIRKAYEICGHPERLQVSHYPKYSDEKARKHPGPLPKYGMNAEDFEEYFYVDSPDHSFRREPALRFVNKWFFGKE